MTLMQKDAKTEKMHKTKKKHYTNKFLQNRKKPEREIFAFRVITLEPIKI